MREYHLAVIAGDGIGREVMPEALMTLDAVAEQVGGLRFTYQHFDWGSEHYLAHGAMMAEDGLPSLERGGFRGCPARTGRRSARGGPHQPLGAAAAAAPGLRPVRQSPPDTPAARR